MPVKSADSIAIYGAAADPPAWPTFLLIIALDVSSCLWNHVEVDNHHSRQGFLEDCGRSWAQISSHSTVKALINQCIQYEEARCRGRVDGNHWQYGNTTMLHPLSNSWLSPSWRLWRVNCPHTNFIALKSGLQYVWFWKPTAVLSSDCSGFRLSNCFSRLSVVDWSPSRLPEFGLGDADRWTWSFFYLAKNIFFLTFIVTNHCLLVSFFSFLFNSFM